MADNHHEVEGANIITSQEVARYVNAEIFLN